MENTFRRKTTPDADKESYQSTDMGRSTLWRIDKVTEEG